MKEHQIILSFIYVFSYFIFYFFFFSNWRAYIYLNYFKNKENSQIQMGNLIRNTGCKKQSPRSIADKKGKGGEDF